MSGWITPGTPNVADYTTFLVAQGFSAAVLPADSPYIQWTLNRGMTQCLNDQLNSPAPEYTIAVYNCGTHHLVMMAQDQPNLSFFDELRAKINALGFIAGVTGSGSDQGTSGNLVVPKVFENLPFPFLQYLKTYWGREYLGYVSRFSYPWAIV